MKFILLSIIFALSVQAQTVRIKKHNDTAARNQIEKDLTAISKTNWVTRPTVWLTPERAKELNRVTSRSYITKMERKGDIIVYHWTNGLRGAVTTQRVDQIISKPARDARREQFEMERSESDKIRKERDALKAENIKLKKAK